jgi:hypothetical protein
MWFLSAVLGIGVEPTQLNEHSIEKVLNLILFLLRPCFLQSKWHFLE